MHRAQEIENAVAANIAANANLAAAVFAGRAQTLDPDEGETPAVLVYAGEDSPFDELGQSNVAFIDSLLTVTVEAAANKPTEAETREELFRLRAETHIALMANRTQALAYVIDTRYGGADRPEVVATDAGFSGRLVTRWAVHYRMNLTDPN